MPFVTSVKPQKNNKRLNIFIDSKFSFGIDLDNFVKFKLKEGQEVSDNEIEKIIKASEFSKSLDKLIRFAMVRPRSEKEIKDYFKRKKVPTTLQEELFYRLKSLNLLDDLEFTKWWVEQRRDYSNKSKRQITFELKNKGVNKEIIDTVISEQPFDDNEMAYVLILKNEHKWVRFDTKIKKQKIAAYLSSKGFDWDNINYAIDKYCQKS